MGINEKNKSIQVRIKLKQSLYQQFLKHLQDLKEKNHPDRTQKAWIYNAILKKIERDEASLDIPKAKHLALKLDEDLSDRLEARIEEICKTIPHYTKKQWILDAIEEKLEAEKEIVQDALSMHFQDLK